MFQYIFACLLLCSVSVVSAQSINFSFQYYQKNSSTAKVGLSDVKIKIKITNNHTQEVFEEITDKAGIAEFVLPAGDNYTAYIAVHDRTIPLRLSHLPTGAFSRFSYQRTAVQGKSMRSATPKSTHQNINFTYYYYDREQTNKVGVKGVDIIVLNPKTGKTFQARTNEAGVAKFQLPIQQNYQVKIPIEEATFDLNIAHLSANGSSSMTYRGYTPAYYRGLAVEDSLYQIESAIRERELDSILAVRAKQPGEVFFHFVQDLGKEHHFWEGKVFDGTTADATKSLGKDNAYTPNGTCSAVLRKRGKLTTKKKAGTYTFYAIGLIDDKIYEWQGEYSLEGSQTKVVYLRATQAKQATLTRAEYDKL